MFSTVRTQPHFHASRIATGCCTHSRLIADVLTPQGLKTGRFAASSAAPFWTIPLSRMKPLAGDEPDGGDLVRRMAWRERA